MDLNIKAKTIKAFKGKKKPQGIGKCFLDKIQKTIAMEKIAKEKFGKLDFMKLKTSDY